MDASVSTLAGAIVGGGVTYITQRSADRRREDREAKLAIVQVYDTAIAAVAGIEAHRWNGATQIDDSIFPSGDETQRRGLVQQLDTEGVQRFVKARQEVRVALASAQPYCAKDLRTYWDKSEPVVADEYEEVMHVLIDERKTLLDQLPRKFQRSQMGLNSWQ